MKNKKFNKITKTIIADLLTWSSKANGLPKQEIIDEIFKGLSRGSLKKKGEDVTEYTYIDKGKDSRYTVNFANKTIQQDEKILYEFIIEGEAPKTAKTPKAENPKTAKTESPKTEPKTKSAKSMEQQRQDVKNFLDTNFSIEFSPEGKIKKFNLLNREDKQMGIDMILGGIILCVINNVKGIDDPGKAVRVWLKNLQQTTAETLAEQVDVTEKSPTPRKAESAVAAKKAKK